MEETEHYYYQSLYEVAAILNSTNNADFVLRSTIECVAQTLHAKGCSLILLTPDRKQLVHTAAYGLSDWYIEKGSLSADKSISEALEGKAVTVSDATVDERVQYPEEAKLEGVSSILSVPMKLRGEIIGVVRVYSAEPRQFTADETYFVSAVDNLGAIAVENARLYQALQEDYETLRQEMLEWRATLATTTWPRSLWFLRRSGK